MNAKLFSLLVFISIVSAQTSPCTDPCFIKAGCSPNDLQCACANFPSFRPVFEQCVTSSSDCTDMTVHISCNSIGGSATEITSFSTSSLATATSSQSSTENTSPQPPPTSIGNTSSQQPPTSTGNTSSQTFTGNPPLQPTPTPTPTNASGSSAPVAGIVGGVVGGIVGIAIIVFIIVTFTRRKDPQAGAKEAPDPREDFDPQGDPDPDAIPRYQPAIRSPDLSQQMETRSSGSLRSSGLDHYPSIPRPTGSG